MALDDSGTAIAVTHIIVSGFVEDKEEQHEQRKVRGWLERVSLSAAWRSARPLYDGGGCSVVSQDLRRAG